MEFRPIPAISGAVMLAVLCCLFAFMPKQEDALDKLLAALQKWTTDSPQEKVYLHLDKPYYAVGDTIWFKGYVTTGSRHQLSAISGALYVDLIDERDTVIKALKLPVTAGMAIGDLTLGDELKQGNYRIRAYTQWMRNAGEDYFFDKTFTVGSVFSDGVVTRAHYQYKDIDKQNVLTATLNYTDEKGVPLAGKNVLYRIFADKNLVFTKSGKTDAAGNVIVTIANQNKADLTGAYIQTSLSNNNGKEVIKNFPIKAHLSQSDVQFFPESGSLVNGITSRIAFKAVGIDGLGVNISGQIVDNDNNEVADLTTMHAGMGRFMLRPEANKTYTAKIKFSDGSTKSITLPKAKDDGLVLSVYQPNKDSVLVRIYAKQSSTSQNLNLITQSGGETVFATNIKIEKPMTSVWLEKKAFPTGIAQFTIFNSNGEPLNERIAFIRGSDQLKLNIKPNKGSYKSREQVKFEIEAKDGEGIPAAGNYSVSVIDEGKLPSDEANETSIFSGLLLSSDIKGYIEKPNYYFTNITDETDKALDNLMLTQGYRRFVWQDLISNANNTTISSNPTTPNNSTIQQSNNNSKIKFPAEGYGINISGQVQTLGDKPLANAVVSLISLRAKVNRTAISDANGRFKFDGFVVRDSTKFSLQARTGKKSSDKVKIKIDTMPGMTVNRNPNLADISINIPETLKAYIAAGQKEDEINERIGRLNEVHRLRQVNIKAVKNKKEEVAYQWGLQIPEGHADRTLIIKEKEIEKYGSLGMYLTTGAIPNVRKPNPFQGLPVARVNGIEYNMKVILNGRLLKPDEAEGVFDNSFVESTDIVKIEAAISSATLRTILSNIGPNGEVDDRPALLITTKPPSSRTQYNQSVANITPKGFNKAREFYSPKYNATNTAGKLPDMRGTIYWSPYLKTGTDGKGSFSFYNADGPGTYKVIVEGIDANGQLGRQVFRYQVDGEVVNGQSPFLPAFQNWYVRQTIPYLKNAHP